jgi:polyisoprenoid-binding protein YceI
MRTTPSLEHSLRYLLAWAPQVEAAKAALAQRVVPDAALHAGTLSFEARTTLGRFTGSTTLVTGAIVGASEYARAHGFVEVGMATFGTGSSRRDRALRMAFDVAHHPTVQFALRGATVVSVSLGDRDVTSVLLHGALTMHGITRRVELPASLTRSAAITRVTSSFPLDLRDYGVTRLSRLFGLLRVDPRIDVRVNLWFVDRLLEISGEPEAARPA